MGITTQYKILVTGANGQLGQSFRALNHVENLEYIFADRSTLDITNRDQLTALIEQHKPQVIINCAAYTAVDKAETDTEAAFKINTQACEILAAECASKDILLIHYSTDYVYNLDVKRPILETDPCNPSSVYAQSKYDGELAIIEAEADAIIIRTSWVYSEYQNNFVKTMIRLFDIKDELNVVNDQIGSPTYAPDIASVTQVMLLDHLRKQKVKGTHIYNFSNLGTTDWSAFAKAIAKGVNSTIKINPIPTTEYPTPAKRPLWSVMSKDKIIAKYGVTIPQWEESLSKCLAHLKTN